MSSTRFPTSKQLKNDLSKKRLEKIYLFLGEEEKEKEKFIREIVNIVFEGRDENNYSIGRFHIENDELMDAVSFSLSQSMFSERKVCLMLNINEIQSVKSNLDLLNETLDNLPDTNTLILTSRENKVPKFFKPEIVNTIKVFQFWRHFENELHSYINMSLKKNGIDIDYQAISLLIKLLGRNMSKIDEAIEKIINLGEGVAITSEFIREIVHDEKETTIFEFIDALFSKKDNVYNLLKKLVEDGIHELVILSMISQHTEKLERYHLLFQKGLQEHDILKEIKVIARNRDNFLEQVKIYPVNSIRMIFPLIYETDFRIKSYNYSKRFAANPIFDLVTYILYYL